MKVISSAGVVAEEVERWLIEVQLLLEDLHLIAVEVTRLTLLVSRAENPGLSYQAYSLSSVLEFV